MLYMNSMVLDCQKLHVCLLEKGVDLEAGKQAMTTKHANTRTIHPYMHISTHCVTSIHALTIPSIHASVQPTIHPYVHACVHAAAYSYHVAQCAAEVRTQRCTFRSCYLQLLRASKQGALSGRYCAKRLVNVHLCVHLCACPSCAC